MGLDVVVIVEEGQEAVGMQKESEDGCMDGRSSSERGCWQEGGNRVTTLAGWESSITGGGGVGVDAGEEEGGEGKGRRPTYYNLQVGATWYVHFSLVTPNQRSDKVFRAGGVDVVSWKGGRRRRMIEHSETSEKVSIAHRDASIALPIGWHLIEDII